MRDLFDYNLRILLMVRVFQNTLSMVLLLFLLGVSMSRYPDITIDNIKIWSHNSDNIYRIIFLDQRLPAILQNKLPISKNVEYYSHDCSLNKSIIRTCQPHRNVSFLVIYNRIPIQYEQWRMGVTIDELAENVRTSIDGILHAGSNKDIKEEEILKILEKKREIFMLVENKSVGELQMGYNVLAKEFYYLDFVYFTDLQLAKSFNLSMGNFIHIKLLQSQPTTILQLINNSSISTHFPEEAPKRYDILKAFVLDNMLTRGFDKNMENIQKQRFNLKVRKLQENGQYSHTRFVFVFCDLTEICAEFLRKIDDGLSREKIGRRTSVSRILYRTDMMKNIQLIQIFFHIQIKKLQLPYTFIINGEDPNTSYLPLRYSKQLNINSVDPLEELTTFLNKIDDGEVQNTYLCSGIPKKNGYTGKGAQKKVQKVSFQTYRNAIVQAHRNNKSYLLFISAFSFECPQCTKFYTEYKKLASFLESEENANIVLGVFDLSKDQINLKSMSSVPSVFLWIPATDEPVQYKGRYEFEDVMNFIKQRKDTINRQQPKQVNRKISYEENEEKKNQENNYVIIEDL